MSVPLKEARYYLYGLLVASDIGGSWQRRMARDIETENNTSASQIVLLWYFPEA